MSVLNNSIAVVIPAYNVEQYIDQAIESVLNQPRKPDEIIIVNDGSTDKTREVISKYESNPLIRVLDTDNRGLGPARNVGLAASFSEYVYFLDSDDVMASEFMEVVLETISAYENPDMIVFSGETFFEDGKYLAFNPPDYKIKISGLFKGGPELYRELEKNRSLFSSACLYITRREVWLRSGLRFQAIIHEDEEILLPLFFSVGSCCALTDILFYRRVRAGSIMTSGITNKNYQGLIEVIRSLLFFKQKNPKLVKDNYDLWLSRTRTMLVIAFARSIQSGKIFPNRLMISVLMRVFTPKVFLLICRQYASAGLNFFSPRIKGNF